jgi:hypothetical protein
MDYRGQKLSEYIYAILTILCGGIGWIIGYQQGSFMITFYGWCIGLGLSLLVFFFNLNLFESKLILSKHSCASLIGQCSIATRLFGVMRWEV